MRKIINFTYFLFILSTVGTLAQSIDLNTAIKNGQDQKAYQKYD